MPFIEIPGIQGRVYVPEEKEGAMKKHDCEDCYSCQMCSDARCAQCLKEESRKQEKEKPEH